MTGTATSASKTTPRDSRQERGYQREGGKAGAASAVGTDGSSDQQGTSGKCLSCMELLKHVLVRSKTSRPHILLKSMMTPETSNQFRTVSRHQHLQSQQLQQQPSRLLWRQGSDGSLEVQIPAEPSYGEDGVAIRRRWSRIHPAAEEENIEILPSAASAATAATSNANPVTNTHTEGPTTGSQSTKASHLNNLSRTGTEAVRSALETAASAAAALTSGGSVASTSINSNSALLASSATSTAPVVSDSNDDGSLWNRGIEWLQLSCKECSDTGPEGGARAFVMGPNPLSVVVCSNRLHHQPSDKTPPGGGGTVFSKEQVAEMEEILTHELVHVYDVRKLHLDLRDCENLAYSEVRAAREAECAFGSSNHNSHAPWWYNHLNCGGGSSSDSSSSTGTSSSSSATTTTPSPSSIFFNNLVNPSNYYLRSCVRQKALTATHNLFPQSGSKCLNRVFDTAMMDTRPFQQYQQQQQQQQQQRSRYHQKEQPPTSER